MNAKPSIAQCLRDDWRWLIAGTAVLLALTSAPYLYAYAHAPAGGAFGGLLANPLDGQTYLAKMAQGAAGDWLFHLPFTSEPHEGAFLYTYYLFLGQIAGRLGIALPAIFHLARLVNSLLFMARGVCLRRRGGAGAASAGLAAAVLLVGPGLAMRHPGLSVGRPGRAGSYRLLQHLHQCPFPAGAGPRC